MNDSAVRSNPPVSRGDGVLAALILLLLTAAVAFTWSHVKLLSQDEIFVLQTDSVSSVRELIQIQRNFPISLDPLVFHLLAHGATKVFGPTAFALRLPSILGFLLMQICVFIATSRIAGPRTGLIAMAFPAFTATLFYAPEARPYGLLLGFYALAFVAWQSATRSGDGRSRSLILLAAAIALTLNSHYFGILILIPVVIAEFARTMLRGRIDIPMIGAIAIGAAGIVFTLPFQHAAGEFRKHYYNTGAISLRAVTQAYRSLFVSYTTDPISIQRIEAGLLIVFAIVLIVAAARHIRFNAVSLPRPELIFLLALAALPLFGVLLAVLVTHSIEVRYVLSAMIAVAIFFGIAVEPWLRTHISSTALTALLAFGILLAGFIRIRGEQGMSSEVLASLAFPAALKAQLMSMPDGRLYIQDMGRFEIASYYEPDPDIRNRIALLYSRGEELKYDRHDTASLTAEHMRHFTGFIIVPFAQLTAMQGPHMLVLYHSGWDWTDQALAENGAPIERLGPALGGDAVVINGSNTPK